MAAGKRWRIRLTAIAEDDYRHILRWTAEEFGARQAYVYAETISAALEELSAGPNVLGARSRSDIANGLFTLHVARHGRKGRHFVIFRIGQDERGEVIEVLRLLHDSMDLPTHLPD